MKKILILFLIATIISCSENSPRRPITESSGSEIKESVIRNKKRIKAECFHAIFFRNSTKFFLAKFLQVNFVLLELPSPVAYGL